jgi:phosphate transport system permease protein
MVPWLQDHVNTPLNDRYGHFPLFSGIPYGQCLLAGGLVLAVMITPIITAVTRDVLHAVPPAQREGSLALGTTRWEAIWRVVLPYGRAGIFGAIILGLGRALGETMAVTMVIGNRPDISLSLFNPAYSLASVLANEFAEATLRLHVAALIEVALLLFVVTLIVNAIARWLVWRVGGMRRV